MRRDLDGGGSETEGLLAPIATQPVQDRSTQDSIREMDHDDTQWPALDIEIQEKEEILLMCFNHHTAFMEAQRICARMMLVPLFMSLYYSMRSNVFVLYARTFTNDNSMIGIVLYVAFLVGALQAVLYGMVGDRWRYDYLLIVACMLDVVFFFISAGTTSFPLLAISDILGTQPLSVIYIAWVAKSLPVNEAKQMNGTFLQWAVVGFTLGPVISGIIAFYTSYRVVFFVSAILVAVLFVYVLTFFYGVDSKLTEKQSVLEQYYTSESIGKLETYIQNVIETKYADMSSNISSILTDSKTINYEEIRQQLPFLPEEEEACWIYNKNDRFPTPHALATMKQNIERRIREASATETEKLIETVPKPSAIVAAAAAGDTTEENNTATTSTTTTPSRYEWFLIGLSILQIAFSCSNEYVNTLYYTVYLEDKYNSNTLISTAQISTCCVFFIIAAGFVKYLDKINSKKVRVTDVAGRNSNGMNSNNKNKNKKVYSFSNWLIRVSMYALVFAIFLCLAVFPTNLFDYFDNGKAKSYVVTYFIYSALNGFTFGVIRSTQIMILLELLPNDMSGKVTGFSMLVRTFVAGLSLLVLSFLWHYSVEYFYYVQSVLYGVSLFFTIVMAMCESFVQNTVTTNGDSDNLVL